MDTPIKLAMFTFRFSSEQRSPVVVLIHGGYWYEPYKRASRNGSDLRPLAFDLQREGYTVLNIEYRRVGPSNGGFPETLNDIVDAIDALSSLSQEELAVQLDLDRIALVGHSAGGHLALWRALQAGIAPETAKIFGLKKAFLQPSLVVGLAAVSDLECTVDPNCTDTITSRRAVRDFLFSKRSDKVLKGAPNGQFDRLMEVVSPAQMLRAYDRRTSSKTLFIALNHGKQDRNVGILQSEHLNESAKNYASIETLMNIHMDEDHFAVIDPRSTSWNNFVKPFLREALFE